MHYRGAVALALLVLCGAASASAATVRISEDRGGQIGQYLRAFAALRSSGERVVIDGSCLSACTMVLGLIPHDRICATSRARLGFHAAWMPDENGRPVTSRMGTEALWNVYPAKVRHWINRHGGLSRTMIFMQGSDLHGIVPSCDSTRTASAQRHPRYSHHRTASRHPVRYYTASAASPGR